MGARLLMWCWCATCVWCSGSGAELGASPGRAGALGTLRAVFEVPGADSGMPEAALRRGWRRRVRPAPAFMRALYEAVAPDPRAPLRGHVVRSYGERGNVTASDVILFDISGLASTEVMVEAELHLYRKETPAPLRDIVGNSNETSPYYLVRVYQCLSAPADTFPLDSHRLLGVQHVAAVAPSAGWHVINVRAAVADWLAGRRPNLGFLVHVVSSAGRPVGERVQFARRGAREREPALVIFTRDGGLGQDVAKQSAAGVVRRRWRSVVDGVANGARLPESQYSNETPDASLAAGWDAGDCRLQDLWVDFGEVGLAKWIAAPERFNCGQCVGKCWPGEDTRPLTTNHAALLGALRRLGRPRTARRPACTPTALRPLTTLTCHPEGNYCALRVLEDLVAEGCGCH